MNKVKLMVPKLHKIVLAWMHECLKVLGKECRRVECKSAKLWGEMVKEFSDGVTETQILQKLWKK